MATVVDLGKRASFFFGATEIRPASCEVLGPGGREALEPRVMQVLVALASAEGETVTRDQLNLQCWGGRIVSDDSINRAISRIRQIARGAGAGTFEVETIPKIGYRLVTCESPTVPANDRLPELHSLERRPAGAAQVRRSRAWFVAIALLAALVVAATTLAVVRRSLSMSNAAAGLEARDLAARGAAASFEGTPAQTEQAIGYFRQAIGYDPNDAGLYGAMAINQVFALRAVPTVRQAPLALAARHSIAQALTHDSHEGHALAARALLTPGFRNWSAKAAVIGDGVQRAGPDAIPTLYQSATFLAAVGRSDESLGQIDRAYALHPLVPWIATARIVALTAAGRLDEAEAAADRARSLWPRYVDLWRARYFLALAQGRPDRALQLVDAREGWPPGTRAKDMAALHAAAEAIARPSSASADAVLATFERLAADGQDYAVEATWIAAYLERPDAAMGFAERLLAPERAATIDRRFDDRILYPIEGERPTGMLFMLPADRLWTHPRFFPLMERIGLLAYWRASGGPDLCRRAELRSRCSSLHISPRD